MNKFTFMVAPYALAFQVALGIIPALAQETASDQPWTPLQVALWPPLQFPNTSCSVYGLSLGVFAVGTSENENGKKFPPGRNEADVIGLQVAGFSACSRELCGFQASIWRNIAVTIPLGLQVGCFNQCESGAGLQLALLNRANNDFTGIQVGLCNFGEGKTAWVENNHSRTGDRLASFGHHSSSNEGVTDMRGLQLGLMNKALDLYGLQCGLIWNYAEHGNGLQIGLVNIADTMTGVQIGLVNIIKENPMLFLPIINAHF